MPSIKRTQPPAAYVDTDKALSAEGDKNYCAVIAIAAATGASHTEVKSLLTKAGRKDGRGTDFSDMAAVIAELGFKIRKWNGKERDAMIRSYPKAHRKLKSLTTHHPRRFPDAWASQTGSKLLFTRGHVAALVDGQVIDYSVNRALRIWSIWDIVPA